jgi:hypothetical protein
MLQMLHFIGSRRAGWCVKWRGTKRTKEIAMLNKLILAATGLALSAPVLADRGHRDHGRYGHDRRVVVHERHVVHRPVVVHQYQYHRPAPRPVYVVRHAPPPPPVVVHHSHSHAGPALVFGALLGAAVVHSVINR